MLYFSITFSTIINLWLTGTTKWSYCIMSYCDNSKNCSKDICSFFAQRQQGKPIFWTRGLPEGVLSNRPCLCECVCVCVCVCVRLSVFKYLRDCLLVFSSFLHEVRASIRIQKWQSPIFEKNRWGSQMGKTPFFRAILISLTLSNTYCSKDIKWRGLNFTRSFIKVICT